MARMAAELGSSGMACHRLPKNMSPGLKLTSPVKFRVGTSRTGRYRRPVSGLYEVECQLIAP